MSTASVTLTHTGINGGNPVRLLNSIVTVSGKKNIDKTPDVNTATEAVEVQTLAFENLKYVINRIHLTGDTNTLTYSDILTLYKHVNNGSNAAVLNILYGDAIPIPALSGSTSGIKVELETPSIVFDTADSRDASLPMASLTFIETG